MSPDLSNNLRLELDRDLIVVDVGCRWGFADAFVHNIDQIKIYGFDPDQEECVRLKKLYSNEKIILVPVALSDHEGIERLHITKEPACSSIYEPDSDLIGSCPALECAQKVDEIEVNITTLDLWSERSGIEHIDHIKIDTQGSELNILEGASNILNSVRTLEVEVEFNPIYKGQPLFSNVDLFLRDKGFVLWKLTNLVHYGRAGENQIDIGDDRVHYDHLSQPIKKYGGQIHWADAHYVRKEIAHAFHENRYQRLRDIVLLSILSHFDLVERVMHKNAELELE